MLKKLSIESMVLIAICLADLGSTIFLVSYRNFSEGNPLMSYYLDHGIAVFVLAKITLFVCPLFILEWARRRRPAFATMASRACIGLYVIAYVTTVVQLNQTYVGQPQQITESRDPLSASMAIGK